ncbi:MAG: hypothetical protein R3266_01000 [Gemmatimonadota bacterium]|nr:hypothetical protein [Gemmatimonadota bacterium]
MSTVRRVFATAALMILGFSLVPVSLAPTGSLEVAELCASGDCLRKSNSFCWIDGTTKFNYKNVIS